uniref:Uncharacterized protein n=1 Tax=Amphimedon queenslandica TaxID=400682 RepID=A0A1X7T6N0_AMPQE
MALVWFGWHQFSSSDCLYKDHCISQLIEAGLMCTRSSVVLFKDCTLLERAVKLGKKDQNLLIENIVQSKQNEVSFNISWLEDLYEEIILETQEVIGINLVLKESHKLFLLLFL